tara:strand:- start:328 stop:528 length:201 start_codon:yes stop_codon:yes gene_type:complete
LKAGHLRRLFCAPADLPLVTTVDEFLKRLAIFANLQHRSPANPIPLPAINVWKNKIANCFKRTFSP